jgi:murein DD-endopeptidase MepM/ murein hydrolase activator NlpD
MTAPAAWSAPALSTRPAAGVWPLDPRPAVVHRFDPPAVTWGRGHRGVDLAGRVGQPVRAAVAGQVTFAGRIAGVGTVAVSHGATRTTYQPVRAAVKRGDAVAAGQRLGRLEWHGTHCAPSACLHWGLLRGRQYLDPLSLVDAPGPVRLLPGSAPIALRLEGVPAGTPAGAAPW